MLTILILDTFQSKVSGDGLPLHMSKFVYTTCEKPKPGLDLLSSLSTQYKQ